MTVLLEGFLRELEHHVDETIQYDFVTDDGRYPLNELMGQSIAIQFTNEKRCMVCNRKVSKLYQGGYCFPCVTTLAECDLCIVKPHECHYHLGTCRDNEFAMTHCMIPHYVYLAFSSGVKVGLTRKGRQLRRWVDQGAVAAVLFAQMPTRKAAGELEMEIAQHLPDKTDWRKMLKEEFTEITDLVQLKAQISSQLPDEYRPFVLAGDTEIHRFRYPRLEDFSVKLTSLSFDKTDSVQGTLSGIKGQYLLFEHGVLNVKKHTGYRVQLSVG